jgi:hypothetical protein
MTRLDGQANDGTTSTGSFHVAPASALASTVSS